MTRLLLDALQSLGHTTAAEALQRESGVTLHRPQAAALRAGVLSGHWQQADDALDELSPRDGDADAHLAARWLLRRQKLVEVAQTGDLAAALALLRTDLAPLPVPAAALHATAAVLLCTSPGQLAHALKEADRSWGVLTAAAAGQETATEGVDQARAQVLARITRLLSPADVVPERRLEALLEQALLAQVQGCLFHNAPLHAARPSLLRDYSCGAEHLPTVCCSVLRSHSDEVWHLAFSPGPGTRLATGCKDGTACVWRLQGSAQGLGAVCELSLVGHTGAVTHLSWAPHGALLLTCSSDRTARVWDTHTGACLHILAKHSDTVTSGAWESPSCVYTAGNDKKIIAWDLSPVSDGVPRERACWRVPRVNDMAFSPDGTLLAAVCAEKRVRLWWPASGREHWLAESEPMTSLCLSAQGRFLLLHMQSQELHLWDLAPQQQPGGTGLPASRTLPTAPVAKFRPGHVQSAGRYIVRATLGGVDQHFVASGSEDSQVYIWHRQRGDLLAVLPGHTSVVNAVQWNASQPGLLASASDDRTVRLWASEALLARLRQGEPLFDEE